MRNTYVLAAIVALFLILFFAGSVLSERCVNIAGCKQCWKTTSVVVTSDLCSENKTCLAAPADQQNNAIVDAVVCACAKAKLANYADASINTGIQDVIREFSRFNLTASDVCEQPGMFLTKRFYG